MSKKRRRPNLNQARNMDVDAWRVRQINRRTKQLIDEQNRAFMEAHTADTEEDLREYVRHQARIRRRMPHPLELQGGLYLRERLGNWDDLARSLGYDPADRSRGRKAYLRLRERGEALFLLDRKQRKCEKALLKELRGQTGPELRPPGREISPDARPMK